MTRLKRLSIKANRRRCPNMVVKLWVPRQQEVATSRANVDFSMNAIHERLIPSVLNNDIISYVTDLSQMQGKETEIPSTEHA